MTSLFRPAKNDGQKSKFILGGIVVSLMLMSYQNCGKVSKVGPGSLEGTVEQKPAVMNLDSSTDLTLLKSSDEGFGFSAYRVDIKTGLIEKTLYEVPKNDPSNVPVLLCLSEELRTKLEEVINNSKLCLFKNQNDPNVMCTQIYDYPYAIITQSTMNISNAQDKVYKLGERTSGCSDVYDICEDNRQEFIDAVKEILADIDLSLCK